MDLGTIKKKLSLNVYLKPKDWVDEVNQVFINCKLFNGAENFVAKLGSTIQQEFERLLVMNNFEGEYINKEIENLTLFLKTVDLPDINLPNKNI